MLFNSSIFIFIFLPLCLLFYYLANSKYRNIILLFFSVFFYSWGEPDVIIFMLLCILINYFSAILIEIGYGKKALIFGIVSSISMLFYFKYFVFFLESSNTILSYFNFHIEYFNDIKKIALPIGISFYTFQSLSYLIDVYRKEVKAQRNLVSLATLITMFPHLIAGPIIRYKDLENELAERKLSLLLFSEGTERFILGLAKKVIIANSCAYVADNIFNVGFENLNFKIAWLGIIAYTLQIYFDFSAYSDMAIGLAKMLGFRFRENFNYPYTAKSIQDFWRRWHISLSSWFRDYVYIPLGGNRVSNHKLYFNLFIVFFLTGLWHGASFSFVFWGLFHGLFLVLEKVGILNILIKIPIINRIYTILIVMIGWVFFRVEKISDAFLYIKSLFGFGIQSQIPMQFFIDKYHFAIILLGIIFIFPVYNKVKLYYNSYFDQFGLKYQIIVQSFYFIFLISLFIISISFISSGTYSPFIYFRF
jgi:alginate O-acetyltransferase complex protein AlgI